MKVPSTEPEYSLEESEKMPLMEKPLDCITRDYQEVLADLHSLEVQVRNLVSSSISIASSL